MVLSRSGLSIVVLWIYTYNFASRPSSPKVFSVSGISRDSMNRCQWWQFRYVQDKKPKGLRQCLSMYIFRWFQANDKESCISFTLEYIYLGNLFKLWLHYSLGMLGQDSRLFQRGYWRSSKTETTTNWELENNMRE